MNCFYHPDQPAVGLCKSCGRGICPECAADIGDGLACRNRCEERGRRINAMVDGNTRIMAVTNRRLRLDSLLVLVLGLIFFGLGIWLWLGAQNRVLAIGILSVAFLYVGYAVMNNARSNRYPPLGK